jgi:uncharacterized glyoxalase superfamily protein PhnB
MTSEKRQSIFAALRYKDAWSAIEFLEKGFGFERQALYEGPNHTVAHAEFRLGNASVGLNSASPPVPGNHWTTVDAGIYVALPDAAAVNAHHERARAAGAEIARPLQDTDYGSREYSVWDVERHLWSFGTYSHAVAGEPALFIELRYERGQAALDWLTHAFGFERVLVVPGSNGHIAHAELKLGDSLLFMSASPDEAGAWGKNRQATYIYVADPDSHYRRAVDAGAKILRPPQDTPYGARAYYTHDPEGFLWGFSTYRGALASKQVGTAG